MSNKPRLLLVEDDRLIRDSTAALLEDDGFEVRVAADGAEALALLEREVPDLVLSDIRMPRVNGFELLERARAMPGRRDLPFVFMSAMAATGDIRTGMSLGADDYITKPFEPGEICGSVRTRLNRARALREVAQRQESFLTRYLPHELRTPLNGVLGFASLMIDTAAEGRGLSREETEEFGRNIDISGRRLLAAADNLTLMRELGDLLARDSAPQSAVIPVAGWAEPTKLLARKAAEGFGRENDLLVELDPIPLAAPGTYLPRVFALLVDNACKFSLPGTPITVRGRKEGERYRLVVTDRGRGMTPEQVATVGLFQQFERTEREQQGLGLGFEIASRFARLAGAGFVLEINQPSPGLTAGFLLDVLP
jgi:two-component system sensor histidine kinase/response regulator